MVTAPDLLLGAGVLADLLVGQRGPPEQLVAPLPRRNCVGDKNERGRLGGGHGGGADDGLAGPAGEHDDPGPAVPEGLHRLLLVGAEVPPLLGEGDLVRLAVDVAGVVLGGPAQLEQRLLEVAPLGGVDDDGQIVDPGAEHALHLLGAQHLLEHRTVGAGEHEPVRRVLLEAEPAVAVHRLGDVDEQRVRHRVARVGEQGVDDLLGVVARRACVPQPQRGQPVGVDVLGGALELRERRDRLAAVDGQLVVDLEQEGLVRLDDERAVIHAGSPRWCGRSEQRPGVLIRRVYGEADEPPE